mgnify:CR=1 FL=1
MTKAERARELFLEGCNCAQAVFLAFAEEKMDRDTALKIASGFGGGMAGMRNVCGAVNGMFMAYGLLCGPADPTDRAAKAKSYETLRQLAGEFEVRNGSLICRQLLGLDPISNPSRLSRAPTAITKNVRVRKWSTARQTFSRSIYPKKAENRHIGTREGLLRLLQTGKR